MVSEKYDVKYIADATILEAEHRQKKNMHANLRSAIHTIHMEVGLFLNDKLEELVKEGKKKK